MSSRTWVNSQEAAAIMNVPQTTIVCWYTADLIPRLSSGFSEVYLKTLRWWAGDLPLTEALVQEFRDRWRIGGPPKEQLDLLTYDAAMVQLGLDERDSAQPSSIDVVHFIKLDGTDLLSGADVARQAWRRVIRGQAKPDWQSRRNHAAKSERPAADHLDTTGWWDHLAPVQVERDKFWPQADDFTPLQCAMALRVQLSDVVAWCEAGVLPCLHYGESIRCNKNYIDGLKAYSAWSDVTEELAEAYLLASAEHESAHIRQLARERGQNLSEAGQFIDATTATQLINKTANRLRLWAQNGWIWSISKKARDRSLHYYHSGQISHLKTLLDGLDVYAAGKHLNGYCPEQIYRWARTGRLSFVRLPNGTFRFSHDSVEYLREELSYYERLIREGILVSRPEAHTISGVTEGVLWTMQASGLLTTITFKKVLYLLEGGSGRAHSKAPGCGRPDVGRAGQGGDVFKRAYGSATLRYDNYCS